MYDSGIRWQAVWENGWSAITIVNISGTCMTDTRLLRSPESITWPSVMRKSGPQQMDLFSAGLLGGDDGNE